LPNCINHQEADNLASKKIRGIVIGIALLLLAVYYIASSYNQSTGGAPSVKYMEVNTSIPPTVLTGYAVVINSDYLLKGDDGKTYHLFVLQGMQIDLAQFINKRVQVQGFLAVSSAGDASLVLKASPILA
jgi:hypothetical protein